MAAVNLKVNGIIVCEIQQANGHLQHLSQSAKLSEYFNHSNQRAVASPASKRTPA